MFLAFLALRNLSRNLRRTIITGLAVVFGVAIQIIGWGFVDGLDENFIRASAWTTTGDILLRPEGYPTDNQSFPLDQALPMPAGLQAQVKGEVAGRTLFSARLVKGAEDSRVAGIAYDAVQDPKVFPREHWRIEGVMPAAGALEVGVGDALARLLKIGVGDQVVVSVRTQEGAMNALGYTVSAIVHTDNAQLDNVGLWVEQQAAADLVRLDGRLTHIAIKLASGEPEDAIGAVNAAGWTAHTVREEVADFLAVNAIRRAAIMIVVFVIMLIAALGIANTVIMAAYERVREIGTLLALGMPKRSVGRMFLFEGAILGGTAGIVGAGLGVVAVMYWEAAGINLGGDALAAAKDVPMSAFIYAKFRVIPVIFALVYSAVVAVLASLAPARLAANLNPADAVRAD